jgi:serralysin
MHSALPRLATACVLAAGALGPSASITPAHAATGSTIVAHGNDIRYQAGSGKINMPSLSIVTRPGTDEHSIWKYTVHDVAAITPGTGCYRPDATDPTTAACDLYEGGDFNPQISLYLGDLADRTGGMEWGTASVFGGPGNDILIAPPGSGNVYGEAGDDILAGDWAVGGDGDDRISNARYGNGGAGDDTITGTDDPQYGTQLLGGPGNDRITGSPGGDLVYGNSGRDLIRGGRNGDDLHGGPDADTIYGNSGNDHLTGGPAEDLLSGGPGTDVLKQ